MWCYRLYAPYRRLVDLSFEWGHGDAPRGTLKMLREATLMDDSKETTNSEKEDENTNPTLLLALCGILIGSLGFVVGRAASKRN